MTQTWRIALVALWGCGIACGGFAALGRAANPFGNLFKKVDADPNKSYVVGEAHGPWMIMATVFRGDSADDQARELVHELRSVQRLEAFTHVRESDFTQTWQGSHVDRYGRPEVMKNMRAEKVREVAVLVGNYSSLEDPDALNTLKKIKALDPAAMSAAGQDKKSELAAGIEDFRQQVNKVKKRKPMATAFICTNPLLPKEYFNQPGLDKFVLQMNSGMKFSLLDCPGKYSVKVATFRGSSLLDQKKIQEVSRGKPMVQKLQDAGDQAAILCESLREKGYEAWQFHDRHESVVCIGSFAEVGRKRTDGKTEIDPRIHTIMQVFGPESQSKTNPAVAAAGGIQPKISEVKYDGSLMKFVFDLQPIPVEVPKRGVAARLQR